MSERRCGNCEFWAFKEQRRKPAFWKEEGICHRFPPTVLSRYGEKPPVTLRGYWCGEFQPRTEQEGEA